MVRHGIDDVDDDGGGDPSNYRTPSDYPIPQGKRGTTILQGAIEQNTSNFFYTRFREPHLHKLYRLAISTACLRYFVIFLSDKKPVHQSRQPS